MFFQEENKFLSKKSWNNQSPLRPTLNVSLKLPESQLISAHFNF